MAEDEQKYLNYVLRRPMTCEITLGRVENEDELTPEITMDDVRRSAERAVEDARGVLNDLSNWREAIVLVREDPWRVEYCWTGRTLRDVVGDG